MAHPDFDSDQWPYGIIGTTDLASACNWSHHGMHIIDGIDELNLRSEPGVHTSYGDVEPAQPQPDFDSPFIPDIYPSYYWDTPSSSTESTPSQLYTPPDNFDHLQTAIYCPELEGVYMGPPDSFRLKDSTQHTFPSQGNITIDTERGEVASRVIRMFSDAYVLDKSNIRPRSRKVLFTLAAYTGRQRPEIQSWLIDSAKTKIGTDANCHAAAQRKRKEANRLYPCYWCLRPFTTKNNLGNHVRAHMNLKISRCPCGYESTNATIPNRHREKCNAISKYEHHS